MALKETLVSAIRALPRSANTAVNKDIGLYEHNLHPSPAVTQTWKKSSAGPQCVAVTATHVLAAQADKAVVHVYSRERGNQESLVAFPEKITCLTLATEGVVAMGTMEGRLILWEILTGRQIMTPTAHLQRVSTLAASTHHLASGSDDARVHVWSIVNLLTSAAADTCQPVQTLSHHRAAVTAVAFGHSETSLNFVVSASADKTLLIWNHHNGELLRTVLLPAAPLCLVLDPCDRAVYLGYDNGALQHVDLVGGGGGGDRHGHDRVVHELHDPHAQIVPVRAGDALWQPPAADDVGAALCLAVSYDATTVYSGHERGRIARWDTGRRIYAGDVVADANAPVTNLVLEGPLRARPRSRSRSRPTTSRLRAGHLVKPKMGGGAGDGMPYTLTARLVDAPPTTTTRNATMDALAAIGLPDDMLNEAVEAFARPAAPPVMGLSGDADGAASADEQLRRENDELWKLVGEQRELQALTWRKLEASGQVP